MEELNTSEDFFARWANETLSDKERIDFEQSKDYIFYKAILEGTEALEIPKIDKNEFYNELRGTIKQRKQKKVVPFNTKWLYGIAASIVLVVGYTLYFQNKELYTTSYGEQLVVTLPDNSEVILNAKSELKYSTSDWDKGNRKLNLKGEGVFKVQKGSDFIVNFKKGNVSVLGTTFAVNTYTDNIEVVCFEGKVKAIIEDVSQIINKGESVRYINNTFEHFITTENVPGWVTNTESKFNNAPITSVIKAIENQYNITINSDAIDKTLRFTGSFTNKNKIVALNTVFDTMEIKFTFTGDNTIYLSTK